MIGRALLLRRLQHQPRQWRPCTTVAEKEMDEQAFRNKFDDLMAKLKELPEPDRMRLNQLAEDAKKRRQRIQTSVSELQESLDHLRLSVKYLVFDLEATRRENAYLRKLLDHANRNDSQSSDENNDDYFGDDKSGAD